VIPKSDPAHNHEAVFETVDQHLEQQCIHMYIFIRIYVCVCVCVCTHTDLCIDRETEFEAVHQHLEAQLCLTK